MQFATVKIEKPDDINFILGQSHFIKTVEDIHEAMVQAVPGIKFGLAFCESSGEMLVRWSGTDEGMIELAKRNALALSSGHSFILFLGAGFFQRQRFDVDVDHQRPVAPHSVTVDTMCPASSWSLKYVGRTRPSLNSRA